MTWAYSEASAAWIGSAGMSPLNATYPLPRRSRAQAVIIAASAGLRESSPRMKSG